MNKRGFFARLVGLLCLQSLLGRSKVEHYMWPSEKGFKTMGEYWAYQRTLLDDRDWKCVMEAVEPEEYRNHIYGFCAKPGCEFCFRSLKFTVTKHDYVTFGPEVVGTARRILKACYA